jgi:hypothetical protein
MLSASMPCGTNKWSNFRMSDTVTIYRDTLLFEATRGRYKEATRCIITTSITASEHHGNSVPGPLLAAKAAALLGHSPADSNRRGEERSALEVLAEGVGQEAEHGGATFAPPSSRC